MGKIPRFWLILFCALGLAFPARAAADFLADDDEDAEDKVAEVAPAAAGVHDRYSVRNAPIDLRRVVRVGEKLKYQVHAAAFKLPVGTLELECPRIRPIRGRDAMVMKLIVTPNDISKTFYPVRTTVISNVDVETGRSLIYSCRQSYLKNESLVSREETIHFNYGNLDVAGPLAAGEGAMAQTLRNRLRDGKRQVRERSYELPGDMQDTLSTLYYGRGLDLDKVDDQARILVGGMSEISEVSLTVVGEETVAVPRLGKVDCLVVQPRSEGNARLANFQGKARLWLERNTRIPVKLELDGLPYLGRASAILIETNKGHQLERFAAK